MKIPKIHGPNKIRDAKICTMWAHEYKDIAFISEEFKLSIRRIQQIVYNNKEYVKSNKDWEKTKRIHWLNKQLSKGKETKKDPADLIEQLRKEIDGDKPLVNIENHSHFSVEKKGETIENVRKAFASGLFDK